MGSRFQQKEQHQFMMCHQSIWCFSEQTEDEAGAAGRSLSVRSDSRAKKPRDDVEQDGQSHKAPREKSMAKIDIETTLAAVGRVDLKGNKIYVRKPVSQ